MMRVVRLFALGILACGLNANVKGGEKELEPGPKVGIGVLVVKGDQILLGKRINAHGDGTWQATGGHLRFGETPEDCAIRETLEETGLQISQIIRGPYTNDFFPSDGKREEKHYITLFMLAKYEGGEPVVKEPDRCERWEWFKWTELPNPLFEPINNLIAAGFSITDVRWDVRQ